jgi:2-succinyl-6-hydroxy-2,4-cyclohexadiene-1-carboxylate synthase
MLYVEERGSGPRLALVHGFTQSGRAWGPVGDALAESYRLLAIDAPGHGHSSPVEADLPDGADLMAETVRGGGPAAWLGYSMGGRFALQVALRRPDVVTRLVVVSATGGIDDPAERSARRQADETLAGRIEAGGLEPFVQEWLAQPMFSTLPPDQAHIEARLSGTVAGLASSLRLAGTGTQEPLWGRLATLEMPVLVVAGGKDEKYRALADRLGRAIGLNAAVRIIEDAGHACHLERPDEFVTLVGDWLG